MNTEEIRAKFIELGDKAGLVTEDRNIDYHTDEFKDEDVDELWRFILSQSALEEIDALRLHITTLEQALEEAEKSEWVSVEQLPLRHEMGYCLIYRPEASETRGSKAQIVPMGMVKAMTGVSHWTPIKPPKGSK